MYSILILEKIIEDALTRIFAYVIAGTNRIMIHSRKKETTEIHEFTGKYKAKDESTPLVVVSASLNNVTKE